MDSSLPCIGNVHSGVGFIGSLIEIWVGQTFKSVDHRLRFSFQVLIRAAGPSSQEERVSPCEETSRSMATHP